jgi:hypothetical protein
MRETWTATNQDDLTRAIGGCHEPHDLPTRVSLEPPADLVGPHVARRSPRYTPTAHPGDIAPGRVKSEKDGIDPRL